MKKIRFGPVQMRIMQILWKRKKASANAITEELMETIHIDHRNVQTLLRELENKKAVDHEKQGRQFEYFAIVSERSVRTGLVSDLLSTVFHGSVSSLVSGLIKDNMLSAEDIDELSSLVDDRDMDEKS